MSNSYECGICKLELECDEVIPTIKEEEIFICPSCEEVIYRLTGQELQLSGGGEDE